MLLNSQNVNVETEIDEEPFEDVPVNEWFAPFISKAKDLSILEETGNVFIPNGGMTRAGICENLFRLLTY